MTRRDLTQGVDLGCGGSDPGFKTSRPVVDVANCMNKQESQAYCLAVGHRGRLGRVLGLGSGGCLNGYVYSERVHVP